MATTLAKGLRGDRVGRVRLREACRVEPSASIQQAVREMARRRTGFVLVMRGRDLLGIFTERDFLHRVVVAGMDVAEPVEKVMTPSPKTISAQASVQEAVELMQGWGFRHLPVLGEDEQPAGVLSVKDIMHYLVEYFPANVYNLPPTPDQSPPAREGA